MWTIINILAAVLIVLAILYEVKRAKIPKAKKAMLKAAKRKNSVGTSPTNQTA